MPAPRDPGWKKHFARWEKRYRFTPEELDAAWDDAWRIYQLELKSRGQAGRQLSSMWASGLPPSREKPYDVQNDLSKLDDRRRMLVIQLLSALRLGDGRPPSLEV